MKKLLALVAILMLASSQLFAAGAVLSDKQMDEVNAGDWVVLTDADGNQTTSDVYHTNNTLDLYSQSQSEIKAVSNANAVDSAIAVQNNISRVSGDTPTTNVAVNGANAADLANSRPASQMKNTISKVFAAQCASEQNDAANHSESFTLGKVETSGASSSAGTSLSKNLNYNETLNATASLAASSAASDKVGRDVSATAASALVDYDKVIVATDLESTSSSSAENESETLNIAKLENCAISSSSKSSKSLTVTDSETTETRDSESMNNHIDLEDTSQMNINAVSNLNAVGAAAAIQTNIASNVGVSGTITHSNTAKVVSGL